NPASPHATLKPMNTLKKPISEAKLQANRANARKSTGPRTPAGKARSAQNAITHGLTASLANAGVTPRDITALGEDRNLLPSTIQRFINSWNPATPYEASLVKRLAELEVRLTRCVRMETGLLDADIPQVTPADSHESISSALANAFAAREATFMNYSRYETNLSRAYDRTLKQLLAVRKERLTPADFPASLDETNPTRDENKQPAPTPKASQTDPRFDFDSPVTPIDVQHRRHGAFVPPPEREERHVELLWTYSDEEDLAA
ncbi:MAG: hypothetical protein ABI972_23805, partial [Acidobacteriota bacterium]